MSETQPTDPHMLTRSAELRGLAARLLVPLSIVCSVSIAAAAWYQVKTKRNTIRVTGSATQRITSDLLEWNATIRHRAPSRAAAYRKVHTDVEKAVAYLIEHGIERDEIRISSTEVSASYKTEYEQVGEEAVSHSRLDGFFAGQTLTVTSDDVDKVEAVSREITGLLDQNIPIESSPPQYHYTGLEDLKIEILAEASADARERAERILDAAGGARLGDIVDTHMGVININPANSTATSWEGYNDKSSLQKDVITVVHVTYEVD